MSIEHSQIVACFLHHFIKKNSGRSGPGLLRPVRKSLIVRSGPEGPQLLGPLVKFMFSKNATNIDKIFTVDLTFTK